MRNQNSSVGVVTRLLNECPKNRGSIPERVKKVIHSSKRLHWLWHTNWPLSNTLILTVRPTLAPIQNIKIESWDPP